MLSRAMRAVRWGAVVVVAVVASGCSAPSRGPAVPVDLIESAAIPGFPYARYPHDINNPAFIERLTKMMEARRVRLGLGQGERVPAVDFLAISGGGQDGAYGAGVLCAWTELGTRPDFTIVTGISTGALTSPFAFLGPEYDHILKEMYTTTVDKDIYTKKGMIAGFLGDSMMNSSPLAKLIAKCFTQHEVDLIAEEYAKQRLLLIATTNLDSGQSVIWDIGYIASTKDPRALDLIRKIMLASASIPVAFPPVLFDVDAGGGTYQEMHVDGGAAAQVFIYPAQFNLREYSEETGLVVDRTVYVIRNSKLATGPHATEMRTMAIAGRTIDSLIRTQGVGDLYRIYAESVRDGLKFNVAYIPQQFDHKPTTMFDPSYMKPLFELGFADTKSGKVWHDGPPGFENIELRYEGR